MYILAWDHDGWTCERLFTSPTWPYTMGNNSMAMSISTFPRNNKLVAQGLWPKGPQHLHRCFCQEYFWTIETYGPGADSGCGRVKSLEDDRRTKGMTHGPLKVSNLSSFFLCFHAGFVLFNCWKLNSIRVLHPKAWASAMRLEASRHGWSMNQGIGCSFLTPYVRMNHWTRDTNQSVLIKLQIRNW